MKTLFRVFAAAIAALIFAGAHAASTAPYALTSKDVEAAVAQALVSSGAGAHVAAQAVSLKPEIYESQEPVSARISNLTVDKVTSRWQANLLVMAQNGAVLTALPVNGRYQEMVTLPVLKRQMHTGDIIAREDIDMLDFPLTRTRADVVTEANQIVGQASRGGISPNRPIRSTELMTPAILKKNTVVQMVYRSGALEIVTTGQVLSQGAKGDVVEVRNLNSKQVVRAVVESAQVVTALPVGAVHAAN